MIRRITFPLFLVLPIALSIAVSGCTPPFGILTAQREPPPQPTRRGFVALPTVEPMPDRPPTPTPGATAQATRPAVTPDAAPPPGRVVAMNFGVSVRVEVREPAVQALLGRLGATHVRTSVRWEHIEPAMGAYAWAPFDEHLRLLAALDVTPVVYVAGNPAWAASSVCGVIDRVPLERFGEFMFALAQRYNGATIVDGKPLPRVDNWQLYNEPDNRWSTGQASGFDGCWGRAGGQYAQLLRVAYDAVHKANPQARLIFGGIAGEQVDCPESWECAGQAIFNVDRNGGDFVDDVLSYIRANPGSPYFDVFDFHYYPAFGALWEKWGPGVFGKASYYRARLAKWGIERPMMISEIGRRSDAAQVIDGVAGSDDEQSRSLVRLLSESAAAGIDTALWFTLADIVEQRQGGAQGWGLLRGSDPKPSFQSFSVLAGLLAGKPFAAQAKLGSAVEGYVFGSGDAAVTVAWPKGATAMVRVRAKQVQVTDIHGNETTVNDGGAGDGDNSANGQIALTLRAPVYLGGAW